MNDMGERTGLEVNSNFLQTGGLTVNIITEKLGCNLKTSSWWAVPRRRCSLLASTVVRSEGFCPAAPARPADKAALASHWKAPPRVAILLNGLLCVAASA